MASERRYQLEVLEKTSQENIILYLGTGGGRTLVVVFLVKSLAHNLRLKGDKRIVVFLVPTVILVHQVRLFAIDSVCPIIYVSICQGADELVVEELQLVTDNYVEFGGLKLSD